MQRLTLRLMGPVKLIGPTGISLTPRGMKARGALAIIGSSDGMRVTRSRLQDLLFSEKDPEHGNASLRQLLREIRVAMGDTRDALISGPGWVGFDSDLLRLDMSCGLSLDGQYPEFAADVDIDDPEFEDWIRGARQYAAETFEPAESAEIRRGELPTLFLTTPIGVGEQAGVVAEMILGEAAGRVADLLPVQILTEDGGFFGQGIFINSSVRQAGDIFDLLVKVIYSPSRQVLWSRRFRLSTGELSEKMQECAAQVCLAIIRAMDIAANSDDSLNISFADIFSFSRDKLLRADRTLANLEDRINPAVTLSLRAWVRGTLAFERLTDDPMRTLDEAREFSSKARERGHLNSTAFAVSSFIESYFAHRGSDSDQSHGYVALDFANKAVSLDPQNPIAILSHSRALSRLNRNREAAAAAELGLKSAYSTLNPANWHIELATTCLQSRRWSTAVQHLEAVSHHAPDNRPALRFLAALRYHLKDEEGAQRALLALKKLEPDFSLDLMGSAGYPVGSLRQEGLLAVTKSRLI